MAEIVRVESYDEEGDTHYLAHESVANGLAVVLSDGSTIFVGQRDGYGPLAVWHESLDGDLLPLISGGHGGTPVEEIHF